MQDEKDAFMLSVIRFLFTGPVVRRLPHQPRNPKPDSVQGTHIRNYIHWGFPRRE